MPDGHRWSGYSHEELYQAINSGPGPQASHSSMERWAGVSAALAEINSELHAGVLRSGASWEGAAADKARVGINPLASWADDARAGSEVMRVSAELQADYISKARSDMPPPVPVTAEKPNLLVSAITTLIGGQTDYELQEKASNAAEQRAREVMTTYASSTTSNTNTLGQFHQPPQLVISAGDAVRNDAPGVPGSGWGHGGARGGRGGWGGGRGWRGGGGGRGGRGSTPAVRPPSPTGGSTGTSSAGSAPSTGQTRPSTQPLATGPGTGSFGPGGVIGGGGRRDEDKRRSDVTTTEQHAAGSGGGAGGAGSGAPAGQHLLPLPPGAPLPAGTTSTSSADFGAFAAANAQHAATTGTGVPAAGLPGGAAGQGGDSVHKRTVGAVPAQPAFDPFGGLGGPRTAEDEEDATHDAADYLRETDDIYGVGGFSPPVIGESTTS
ncbi:PPE domain-containing protein [Saccharothrix longispora]|uniref:PPE domain-containing protein n=1 Tax=Saccharothrix longispora TaxID=33920 RepID=UPI0028FD0BE8|nr:PPE domain-containing protein [Saccharothrix longispora]MDU0292181.1 PPE domain-containing protein [Saccharothrix longispora]